MNAQCKPTTLGGVYLRYLGQILKKETFNQIPNTDLNPGLFQVQDATPSS